VREDRRRDCAETRLQIAAMRDARFYIAVVTPRGDDLRVIGFRKANAREVKAYEQAKG
jgi:uncharacterized DUF497 family protein